MGRKSNLTEKQQAEIERRLSEGEHFGQPDVRIDPKATVFYLPSKR